MRELNGIEKQIEENGCEDINRRNWFKKRFKICLVGYQNGADVWEKPKTNESKMVKEKQS